MRADFGLAVSPHFRDSTLWGVSDRALRVWLVLAAHASHVARTQVVDAHQVRVGVGEVLMSYRVLRRIVGGGITQLMKAVAELVAAGALDVEAIRRQKPEAFPERERMRSQSENATRSRFENAGNSVISRFKVHGVKHLPRNGGVLAPGTRSNRAIEHKADRLAEERARVDRLLEAEGR